MVWTFSSEMNPSICCWGGVLGRLTRSPYMFHQNKTLHVGLRGSTDAGGESDGLKSCSQRTHSAVPKDDLRPRSPSQCLPPGGARGREPTSLSAGTWRSPHWASHFLHRLLSLANWNLELHRERVPVFAGRGGNGTDNPQPGPEGSPAARLRKLN